MARKDPIKAQQIRELIKRWDNHNRTNIVQYHEYMTFIMGNQWREDEAKLFTDYKKIPLTVNKLAPQMNHLLGEQRQNTPNLQIQPSDDVQEKTAEVREALIKEISLNSNAKVVYQTVFQQLVIGGFSAYWIFPKYEDKDSFDQIIDQAAFRDPTKCYFDLAAETINKTDGMHAGFQTPMSRKMFRSRYGKKIEKLIGYTPSTVDDDDMMSYSFSDEQNITVINHFERESKMITLYQLSNGRTVRKKELKDLERIEIEGKEMLLDDGEVVTIEKERELPEFTCKHSIWAGDYELESNPDFPSEQLPIIFVDQNSYYDKAGKQIMRPFFKDARDSQRFLNYIKTQEAHLIKISRYDQFLVSKQNVRSNDTQAIWRNPANTQGGLLYDESPAGNVPQQLKPPEISQSLLLMYEQTERDIQMTTGMFDTQMGEQGNEVSGAAIDARTKRGNYNTYVPFDSLNRAIACGGCIINEMIPKVYDNQRLMNLEMKDKGLTKVSINKPVDEYGMQTENDMTTGKFKIRLVPGASFETRKTEGVQSMDMLLSKDPEFFRNVADLYAENLDMPNSIEVRNRYRALIPPEIIEAGKTGEPIPPKQPQQDPMIAIKQQEIQFKMQDAQMKAQQKQHELELKEQQLQASSHQDGVKFAHDMQKLQIQKEESAATLQTEMLRYQAEMARINADVHLGHSDNIQRILTHQPNHFKAEKEKPTKDKGKKE